LYKNLEKIELDKSKFNVFMFHSTLDDLKPDFMKNVKVEINSSFLPKGFNYYAGGHVHTFIKANYDKGIICYPGALFPNNFFELKTEEPCFNICEFENGDLKLKRVKLNIYEKEYMKIEFSKLNPIDAKNKILDIFESFEVENKLILLELRGIIEGKISDIGLNEIISDIYNKGALIVLKNTSKLTSSLVDNYDNEILDDIKELEDKIIESYLSDSKDYKKDFKLIKDLLSLDLSKQDEERNIDYEERIVESIDKSLK
jgi:DNA repair exonuclease SbcCD nuclease subunit